MRNELELIQIKNEIKELIRIEKHNEALKVLVRLLKLYPKDLEIVEMVADVEFKLGMLSEAFKLYITLYKKLPNRKDIRDKVVAILSHIKIDHKNTVDETMNPKNSFVRGLLTIGFDNYITLSMNILGELALEKMKLEEAKEYFEQAIRFGRDSGSGYHNIGIVQWMEGLKNKAFVNFARALKNEINRVYLESFKQAIIDSNNYRNGLMIFDEIIKENQNNNALAQAYNELKRNNQEQAPLKFCKNDKKYDKVNLIYGDPPSGIYTWHELFKRTFERNGLLHYAYCYDHDDPLNFEEMLKYPIICINGDWEPVLFFLKMINGNQYVANINTESLITRSGSAFYYNAALENSKYYNMCFFVIGSDMGKIPGMLSYWLPSWTHTEFFDDIDSPVYDKMGFIGSLHGRYDFFSKDKNKIIQIAHAKRCKDLTEDIMEYVKLINKFKILINPGGATSKGMVGKTFEYMACKRLCFCHLEEEGMAKSRWLFEDGKDIVYYKTFEELEDKYNYYLQNPEKAREIALSGYHKVRKFHNADARIKRIAEITLHHANGGDYDEGLNDINLFGGKAGEL